MSEPKGRGAAWTEERGTSDEGRRRLEAPRRRASGVTVISGTGTGVGKTVVTAALAALAADRGERVAVVKPAQTGLGGPDALGDPDAGDPPEESDLDTVRRLSGVSDGHELARFPDPLSPEAAARAAGRPPLDMAAAARYIAELAATRDTVLVEGAGGLLVRYDAAGATIADLASMLDAPVLVVALAGLGTLNHTALTLEALAARGLESAGVVIGSWPAEPDLAARSNLVDLADVLAGRLPENSGRLGRGDFLAVARSAFATPAFRAAPTGPASRATSAGGAPAGGAPAGSGWLSRKFGT